LLSERTRITADRFQADANEVNRRLQDRDRAYWLIASVRQGPWTCLVIVTELDTHPGA